MLTQRNEVAAMKMILMEVGITKKLMYCTGIQKAALV
jgi:hypothetical protein